MSVFTVIAGTIRYQSPTKWGVLEDPGHEPVGIGAVEIYGLDRVRVHFTEPMKRVVTFSATVDESFAAAGVRCGASVALSYADVFFYMGSSQVPVDPGLLSRANANVWLHGLFIPVPPPAAGCVAT